jgi:hypothetical protein
LIPLFLVLVVDILGVMFLEGQKAGHQVTHDKETAPAVLHVEGAREHHKANYEPKT